LIGISPEGLNSAIIRVTNAAAPAIWRSLWSRYLAEDLRKGYSNAMEVFEPFHLHVLKEVFRSRRKLNSSYSLRAYAKDLKIDSSNLSAILREIRPFPAKRAAAIARKLNLKPEKEALFISSASKKFGKVINNRGPSKNQKNIIRRATSKSCI
jgi:hypothetical protein